MAKNSYEQKTKSYFNHLEIWLKLLPLTRWHVSQLNSLERKLEMVGYGDWLVWK